MEWLVSHKNLTSWTPWISRAYRGSQAFRGPQAHRGSQTYWPSLACLVLTVMLLTGCTGAPQTPNRPFTVAAAASMQNPLSVLGTAFTKQTGQAVTFTFGATGTLGAQIEQGAPYDLFLAANESTPKQLGDKGFLLAETIKRYATGQIVLAISKSANPPVTTLADLVQPAIKRIAIANPDQAPYGKAAVEALKAAGIWERVRGKIVMGESVRQAVQFVESGNAEVGLVARSDAESTQIATVPVLEGLYTPIYQAMGVVKGSPYETVAKQFAQFMAGPEAKTILERYGFAVGS
jgi:molybdate transport system substrate-binding protein